MDIRKKFLLLIPFALSGCGGNSVAEKEPTKCSYAYLENQSNYQLTVTILSKYYSRSGDVVIETGETKELNHGCTADTPPELAEIVQTMVIATKINGEAQVVFTGLLESGWKSISEEGKGKKFYLTLNDLNLEIR